MDVVILVAVLAVLIAILAGRRERFYSNRFGVEPGGIELPLFSFQTIYEFEWALEYRKGEYRRVLPTGRFFLTSLNTGILRFDKRSIQVVIPGQEVLTRDELGLKISLMLEYVIKDPEMLVKTLAINSQYHLEQRLHQSAQISLRAAVAETDLDGIFEGREVLSAQLTGNIQQETEGWGLEIKKVSLLDLMVGKDLRGAYAAVKLEKKKAEAKLESARGETAALRALANAARSIRDNPELLKLRLLEGVQSTNGAKHNMWVDFRQFSDGSAYGGLASRDDPAPDLDKSKG
ncbi:MAG: SPFH domain-containing protein [Pseudomonadota bacterium]